MKSLSYRLAKYVLSGVLAASVSPCRLVAAEERSRPQRQPQAERSTVLTLTIGGISKQISAADLSAMPQTRITVHNGHNNHDEVYTGVALSDLLKANGLPLTKETQGTYLRSYLRAQGSDFYFALYSGIEVAAELSNATVIIATRVDGQDLGQDGLFKLVNTADKRPMRWVRNLISITLVTLN